MPLISEVFRVTCILVTSCGVVVGGSLPSSQTDGGFWLAGPQSGSASDVSAVRKTKQLRLVSAQTRLFSLVTSIWHDHSVQNHNVAKLCVSPLVLILCWLCLGWFRATELTCVLLCNMEQTALPPCYCSPVLMLCSVESSLLTCTDDILDGVFLCLF